MTKQLDRAELDGRKVELFFRDGSHNVRVWDTEDEARTDAAICAARLGGYVFDRAPQIPRAF